MERPGDSPSSTSEASALSRSSEADTPDPQAVTEALSASLREALEEGRTVEVPGLGTFRVAHEGSQVHEQDDGEVSVTPPRDHVVFEPAAS